MLPRGVWLLLWMLIECQVFDKAVDPVEASFSCCMQVCCRWPWKCLFDLENISLIGLFRLRWHASRSWHSVWWLLALHCESQQFGPKALHLWQPGKASVSMGSRYVRWSLPLLGRKIIYSRFPYIHFLSNSSIEFYNNLSGGQQGLTASGQLWSSHVSLSPWEPQKKKRFHVVAPNTKTSLTGIATLEISWPACRNRPMTWCKWLPNAHFLHTKLEKYQQNQQEGDSEGKKGGAVRTRDFSTPFWFLYLSQILRMLSPLLSIHYLPPSYFRSWFKASNFFSAIQID